jgi:extracellular factor (EF) 3-hydroxypalmitic acid methyl ester biosynthesis protein
MLEATLEAQSGPRKAQVYCFRRYSLNAVFPQGEEPNDSAIFPDLVLKLPDRDLSLGRCCYRKHPPWRMQRRMDPELGPGTGRLVLCDSVLELDTLIKKGVVSELVQHLRQLPLVFNRKLGVCQEFKDYTAATVFDLQVYRSLLDEIDRSLSDELPSAAESVRAAAVQSVWQNFQDLFDGRLAELQKLVTGFTREDHERHGFYFRKHVWDLILCSEFMTRTNLKPRGYAGDSEMMRMIYEDEFRGPTIFSRLMHRHPIGCDAAQAVRNRGLMIGEMIQAARRKRPDRKLRVMSIACGPARELRHALATKEDIEGIEVALLDQDDEALAEARAELIAADQRTGAQPTVRYIRESVRTMLRSAYLPEMWGDFDFLYSMGLFDYLTPPVAKAVLARLYQLMAPGGELVIGNFHRGNPSRVYMEYWMDWGLYYRSEEEFKALAAELPGAAMDVFFEPKRAQMFMRLTKDAP